MGTQVAVHDLGLNGIYRSSPALFTLAIIKSRDVYFDSYYLYIYIFINILRWMFTSILLIYQCPVDGHYVIYAWLFHHCSIPTQSYLCTCTCM